jgi:hypothetical protein
VLFQAQGEAHGLPVVASVKGTEGTASQVTAALNEGFAAELLRTVYVTQQYIENARTPTRPSARALAWAKDATPFVLNAPHALGFGVALSGAWLGGPVPRPQTIFVGVPATMDDPQQLVPLLARRIGGYLGLATATAGAFDAKSHLLATAYAQALEVIAREWKGTGGGGAMYGGGDIKHKFSPIPSTIEISSGLYGQYNLTSRFSMKGSYYRSAISIHNLWATGLFTGGLSPKAFDTAYNEFTPFGNAYSVMFYTKMNVLEFEGLLPHGGGEQWGDCKNAD